MQPTDPASGGTAAQGVAHVGGVPPMPTYGPVGLRIAVTRRILWVGTAAYPLAMIARISVTRIVPKYGQAVARFFKLAGILLLADFGLITAIAIADNPLFSSGSSEQRDSAGTGVGWVVGLSLITLIVYLLVDTLPVLTSKPVFAVAVDTAGPPTALIAWKEFEPADGLAQALTRAIENPQAEFVQFVHNHIVDLRHYQQGDSVNIYGGTGITGISK
jgi:hypothetical protein